MPEKKTYILFNINGECYVAEQDVCDSAVVDGFVNFMESCVGVLHLTLKGRQKIFPKTQVTCIELIEAPFPSAVGYETALSWSINYVRGA